MDRYIKKRQIGEGSFGKALLVQCKQDGKEYVIKEINISKMKRKEREESKKEVAVLRKMKHPNIVSYTESFEERGNLYIVMDYCDGGDLFKAINNRRGVLFPEDQIMDWFVQLCLAMKHVHDRKILHRDIKSQNIFLTRKGIVKLGDFGIARVLNNTMELARTCIGTPYYLSPEICENKPYNNKSDIWALGCVLYELLTLKHAFEAGNMKNLVLKIIRGSYPPVSPRYSYEMRNLQAQLFKRNPRDRPSVNSILKKPFIQKRIEKFLTDAQQNDACVDAAALRNVRPAAGVGGAAAAARPVQRPVSKPPVSAAAKKPPQPKPISNPAAKYGPSVAVKRPPSAARKSAERDKKSSAEKDLEQKKKDLIEKERERRRKDIQVKIQQQQLINKQRLAHINKAREAGWKNTLLSSGSSNGGGTGALGGGGGGGKGGSSDIENEEPPNKEPKYERPPSQQPPKAERGNYDHYHQYLDNLRKQANGGHVIQGGAAMFREDREQRQMEEDAIRRQIRDRPVSASAAEAARRGQHGEQAGAEAAERARLVNEFLSRKREAAANKARAAVQLGWAPPSGAGDAKHEPIFPYGGREVKGKDREEQEDDPKVSADARRKKIEALKAQADERAAKLKEQLEKQRREAYDRERRAWEDHLQKKRNDKPVVAPSKPLKGPAAPVVPLTAVLKDVGVDITQPEDKQEIPSASIENKSEVETEEPNSQSAALPRKKWGGAETKGMRLANMPLEETASNMEATSAADIVVKNPSVAPSIEVPSSQAARKKWGAPGNTVVNALQMAEIKAGTMTIARSEDKEETKGVSGPPADRGSPMGVTIVKNEPKSPRNKIPIIKDTMVIHKADERKVGNVVAESADLETIDAKNAEDVKKSKEGDEKTPPKTRKAWSSNAAGDNQTHIDGQKAPSSPPKKETAINDESIPADQPPSPAETSTMDNPPRNLADGTPAKTSPKDSPPKSPRPNTLASEAATSKTSSPAKSPETGKRAAEDSDKKQEKSDEVQKSPDTSTKSGEASPGSGERTPETQVKKGALDVVDLEDEDEESPLYHSAKKSVISGLSTGVFDTAPKLLRTCSDPDLSKLFRTTLALNPFFEAEQQMLAAARTLDMALQDVEDDGKEDDEENEELIRQLEAMTAQAEEEEDEENEEEEVETVEDVVEGDEGVDDNDDEEEEDYQSLVESMKSILEARDAADTSEGAEGGEDIPEEDKASEVESGKSSPSSPDKEGDAAADDEEEDEDEAGESKAINEDWDSGEGSEGEDTGMSSEDRESVYSRLEESRLQLEKELGCETFLKAYKSIQAMHEDEDENIEEGTKRVNAILGDGKGQIYTKILQLVMADGAYTEGHV